MSSLTGKSVLTNRDCLKEILQSTLGCRVPKTSGRDKTLSEVHNAVCSLVRDLIQSPFYVTTGFVPKENLVAAVLSSRKKVRDCICVNIDSPEIAEPIDVEVRLCG